MIPKWNYNRFDLEDSYQNLLRFEEYWKYLLLKRPADEPRPFLIQVEQYGVKSITTYKQADYEAFYMVHSVGANFDKYRQLADIYSVRSVDNIPLITFNVAHNVCIHARQKGNEPLDENLYKVLVLLCSAMGYEIVDSKNL